MTNSRAKRVFSVNSWGFVLPALLFVAAFILYPVIKSLWFSFHSGQGAMIKFVGLNNFFRLTYDPVFHKALSNTLTFLIIQVPIMILLALILASTLNIPGLRARGFWRTAIFLPCVTSLVAYSVLFKSMFSYDGVINHLLVGIGIISEPIAWLADPFWAKVVIITAITWRWTGYNMIFYLAALQNIDKSIYEAARIDGISSIRQFFSITVPMLKPVILFTSVTSTIGTLQLFDEPMNITLGGPADSTLSLSMYIYNLSFKFMPNFGYATTVSYFIVFMVAILAVIQFWLARERNI
ncbi:TPA: sugar ABC transporter permease [Kluyvera georgiana]|nr:sugar ABC transporter permease [Kluyvera georgiana]